MCDDIIDDKEIINYMKNEWDLDNLSSMLEIFWNVHLSIKLVCTMYDYDNVGLTKGEIKYGLAINFLHN